MAITTLKRFIHKFYWPVQTLVLSQEIHTHTFQVVMQAQIKRYEIYHNILTRKWLQLKLAVSYLFSKEEPISIVAIDGAIICGNTFLKRQIHEKKEGGAWCNSPCAFTPCLPWNNQIWINIRFLFLTLLDYLWCLQFILRLKDKIFALYNSILSLLLLPILRNFWNLIDWGRTYLSFIDLTDQIEVKVARERVFNYHPWYLQNYKQEENSCFRSLKTEK